MNSATLPCAWGGAISDASVAAYPEDFRVDEQLSFRASGDGPHLLVQIEKRGMSTTEAIRALASAWQVVARDIGYAGRKDRQAVTRQWLSVPWPVQASLPDTPVILDDNDQGKRLVVCSCARHRRKLPVGALLGNRFRLRLRHINAEPQAINQRLQQIAVAGVPNYFGGQRFGKDARNLALAGDWFGGHYRPRHRAERSMLLSAARSACFNAVLSDRVVAGDWASPGCSDLMILDGRGSLFAADSEPAARLAARAAGLRVHPTGPLPGLPRKGLRLDPALAAREAAALQPYDALVQGLCAQKLEAARRALRMAVSGMVWHWLGEDALLLDFSLPKGCYATTVLRELFTWESP